MFNKIRMLELNNVVAARDADPVGSQDPDPPKNSQVKKYPCMRFDNVGKLLYVLHHLDHV